MRIIRTTDAILDRIDNFCRIEGLDYPLFRMLCLRNDFQFDNDVPIRSRLSAHVGYDFGKAVDLSGKQWYNVISKFRYSPPASLRAAMTAMRGMKIPNSTVLASEACKAAGLNDLPESNIVNFLEELWASQ